jgi:bifunctional non-homologous end joining protein LigD
MARRPATPKASAKSSEDALAIYNAKRDFTRTAEPAGKAGKAGSRHFVVQKHDATRLHWDFRLEVDGVLKSWAVTRGPSHDPDDKRLAVRTEDHPLDYATFEGTIPAGEYGGGTVMLWDQGTWAPIAGKSAADLEEGHLHFTLDGQRMRGEWLLVRMKPRKGEKRENWLLRKVADAEAGEGDTLVETALTSVTTGRTMAQIAAGKPGQNAKAKPAKAKPAKAKPAKAGSASKAKAPAKSKKAVALPAFRPVQLATLVGAVPQGREWIHEIKFDGYRALASAHGDEVRIHTRSGLDWTERFAPIAEALAALDLPGALIDGEIVALDDDGNPSFPRLQAAMKDGADARLAFFAFDLLADDGADLTSEPLLARKERLAGLLEHAGAPIHLSDHVVGAAGQRLFETMCAAGQEGIVSKRGDAPYRGERTRGWVKVKCAQRQEFVIVGYTQSTARGRPFGSLLLAQRDPEGDGLVYRGKVGTGFDTDALADLARRMKPLDRKTAPLDVPRAEARGASWLRPDMVAEVVYATITPDGRLRHASFVGLRADKPAREVVPETAVPVAEIAKAAPSKARTRTPAPADDGVTITHPERVVFPETGETKGELADWYRAMSGPILRDLARRPVSLVRCPQGRAKACFFQKHDSGLFGKEVAHVSIAEKDGKSDDYLYLTDAAGLLRCVQMGTIEFHGWASHIEDVEQPDRMIFDLDPDEDLDFDDVRRAALHIRDALADIGLISFAMLSGGKGIHVVVPLTPGHDWEAHKDFARRFAGALAAAEPDRYVATMSKAKRKGRIFIDWLRNQRGSTAIMPWSVRSRAGAPVAVPVAWDMLPECESAHRWSIADQPFLASHADKMESEGWGHADQTLPDL